jgi:hypothetical protein
VPLFPKEELKYFRTAARKSVLRHTSLCFQRGDGREESSLNTVRFVEEELSPSSGLALDTDNVRAEKVANKQHRSDRKGAAAVPDISALR